MYPHFLQRYMYCFSWRRRNLSRIEYSKASKIKAVSTPAKGIHINLDKISAISVSFQ